MPASTVPNEVLHLTLSVSPEIATHIRSQISSGVYANENEYVESILLSETLFEPVDQDELTHWIETEGVRRLRAMEADPTSALTEEQVFGFLDSEDEETEIRASTKVVI